MSTLGPNALAQACAGTVTYPHPGMTLSVTNPTPYPLAAGYDPNHTYFSVRKIENGLLLDCRNKVIFCKDGEELAQQVVAQLVLAKMGE